MDFELAVKELVELSKSNNNTVYSNDILKYCSEDEDSNDYDKLEAALKEKEIDIVPSQDSMEEEIEETDDEPNLADVEEVDVSTYAHYEKGDRTPSAKRLVKLLKGISGSMS